MKKTYLLYALALVLFVFSLTVLVTHYTRLPLQFQNATVNALPPFSYSGKVVAVKPEAEGSGLMVGDKILTMNGVEFNNNDVFFKELQNSAQSGVLVLTVSRDESSGSQETHTINVPVLPVNRDIAFYARLTLGFLYAFFIPTFCILVGFWVVFVRVDDFLAWMLLGIMLGFSCIGLEGSGTGIINTFAQIFFSTWALSMLLFAIYFPERFVFDIRFPWVKWILIVPLLAQLAYILLRTLKVWTGINLVDQIGSIGGAVNVFVFTSNLTAISLFFAILGYKSGTLENPDSRRRLRLMVWGSSVAMLPSFIIFLYSLIRGTVVGSFYDRTHWAIAFFALLLMLVFPLSLAYVIVVHRAMDVRVVVRQGIQYAFATGGIRVLQFLLLLATGIAVWFVINSYGTSMAAQFAFIAGGVALVPLIDLVARRLRVWIDRRFFRDAYNADQILSDLSEDVRTMVETRPLLETVAGKISESLHVPQVSLLLRKNDSFVPAYSLGFDTEPVVALSADSKSIRKLTQNKHIVLYEDMTEVTSTPTMSLSDREQLIELNAQVLLPVTAKNVLSGIITLSPKRSDEPYTATDLRLLRSVAGQTGMALENSRLTEAIASEAAQKERLNTELEIAREVQERLFPQELPIVEGLDFFGACRPALGVGGDYYDFLELPETRFGIAIGDISGKGVGASLMMASLQASLRGQTLHFGNDLSGLMSQINALVYEASTTNRYATFFYAQFDKASRKLSYVNGGHNPPFLIRANGEVLTLEEGGPVVGMLPPMIVSYSQGEIQLESGDLLVGFTDGISEAMNPNEEEWGEEAMLDFVKSIRTDAASEILPQVVKAADTFADGAKQHDDMTMIIVKVL